MYLSVIVIVFTPVVSRRLEWMGTICLIAPSKTRSFAALAVRSKPTCMPISTRIVSPNVETIVSDTGPITGAATAATPPCGACARVLCACAWCVVRGA